MINRTNKLTALAFLLALLPLAANAAPVQWTTASGGNGHFYEVVVSNNISWDAANTAANGMFFMGIRGHLATITTAAENTFIDTTFRSTAPGELWIGGFQPSPGGASEPAGGWQWVNGEGPFVFTAWQTNEPNDNTGAGSENEAAIFLGGNAGWNDEGNLNNIKGFLVEYDGTVPATSCISSCNPSGVADVDLEDDIPLPPNASITQALVADNSGNVVFRDHRVDANGQCSDRRAYDVFLEHPSPGQVAGTLILDKFTCGSPFFAVLKGNANFDLISGVVKITQLPAVIPGIGNVFSCGFGNPDLQQRTQFTYQTDNRNDMIENAAAVMTSSCSNPSRGATFGFSFGVLNTHEDLGIPFDTNIPAVQFGFKLLAASKFVAADKSLDNARRSLSTRNYLKLRLTFAVARIAFLIQRYDLSLNALDAFLGQLEELEMQFNTSSGFNHHGNLQMRAENLKKRVAEIQDPAN